MRKRIRCLVVDDSEALCRVLCSTLLDYGVAVADFHSDPRDALNSIVKKPRYYDAVFVDLHMDGIDGQDLIKRFHSNGYQGAIVIISALEKRVVDYVGDLVNQFDVNLVGTLLKPIDSDSVAFMLQRIRRKPKKESPASTVVPKQSLVHTIENGHIVAYGQPKFDAKTSQIIGIELLMRIAAPQEKVLLPRDFISVAEDHDLLDKMLIAMLENSLPELSSFADADGSMPNLAINLSPSQLFNDQLPDLLDDVLLRHSVAKERVVLEVTEHQTLADSLQLENLSRLRIHGYRLSLDDFGVGFTSIGQLRAMPFNEVKLDRRFVHGIAQDKVMAEVAKTICSLCHKLNMTLVAEGIEQHDDLQQLESIGVDGYQGFLFCRPKPLEELFRWSKIWNKRLGGYLNEPATHAYMSSEISSMIASSLRGFH
ncbi:EAL domain-containing protein [Aurantivibrio plasticivorans]